MKFEYDQKRDLLYIYFTKPGTKVAKTITVTPGLFVDIDEKGKVIGMEFLDASEFIDGKVEFNFPDMAFKKQKVWSKWSRRKEIGDRIKGLEE